MLELQTLFSKEVVETLLANIKRSTELEKELHKLEELVSAVMTPMAIQWLEVQHACIYENRPLRRFSPEAKIARWGVSVCDAPSGGYFTGTVVDGGRCEGFSIPMSVIKDQELYRQDMQPKLDYLKQRMEREAKADREAKLKLYTELKAELGL